MLVLTFHKGNLVIIIYSHLPYALQKSCAKRMMYQEIQFCHSMAVFIYLHRVAAVINLGIKVPFFLIGASPQARFLHCFLRQRAVSLFKFTVNETFWG